MRDSAVRMYGSHESFYKEADDEPFDSGEGCILDGGGTCTRLRAAGGGGIVAYGAAAGLRRRVGLRGILPEQIRSDGGGILQYWEHVLLLLLIDCAALVQLGIGHRAVLLIQY